MLNRKTLAAAVCAALVGSFVMAGAQAQEQEQMQTEGAQKAKTLDKITVTGSLIPQSQLETYAPVTTISAEDIKARGFTSVSDVLQRSTLATGGVQGAQSSGGFTQGAETVSLFGLDPAYTKYLIDGRPMANYPALYNGSDTFNNISGIPIDLVDRIEILPGGQSSLYGSDAIAGVVNIILKKTMDGGVVNLRGGTYSEGGGTSMRLSAADGFSAADGRFNMLAGVQLENIRPIWGYQRDLTKEYNTRGFSPPVASRDFVVLSATQNKYYFTDPNNCSNVTGQFGGTTGLRTRPGRGDYCGSFDTPGYRTIKNGKSSQQGYVHATFDVNDNFQLYGDALYSHEKIEYNSGSNFLWWGTGQKWGAYYDPALDDLVNLQRAFGPEDIGGNGFEDTNSQDTTRSYRVTFGASGSFGEWDYDLGFTRNEQKLDERNFVRWKDAINDYFEQRVLGPQQGLDPYYNFYPVYTPDYAAFYSPISPADFDSFTGHTTNKSKTWDNLLRLQVTNATLFSLPGGDAGLALVAEGGTQGWSYRPDDNLVPDPDTLESNVWGLTSVSGAGRRTRYALTGELRLPIWEPLTVTLSGRYDAFKPKGSKKIDKSTYSIGFEYRPLDTLLFRGKYGTAFRAPTISDQFQGVSGYYSTTTDYYRCAQDGYLPGNTVDCQYDNEQFFGQQEGNKDLEPLTADVWNVGVVWSPVQKMSLSVDYFSWKLENEIEAFDSDRLLLTEYFCRSGRLDINSAFCQQALSWITRDATGTLEQLYTPKVNISEQTLRAISAAFDYGFGLGRFGDMQLRASYTNRLKHKVLPVPGSGELDLLRNPTAIWDYDAYAKTRVDLSLGWAIDKWTTTVYMNRIGKTPNYQAYANGNFTAPRTGWWAPYITYNLSVNYQALDNLEFSVAVNNVLNKKPYNQAHNFPGTESEPYNSNLYDSYGRAFYVEMRYKFGAKGQE